LQLKTKQLNTPNLKGVTIRAFFLNFYIKNFAFFFKKNRKICQVYTRKNPQLSPKKIPRNFLFEKTIKFCQEEKEKPHDAKPICMETNVHY
jgi:hypothetical protein